MAEANSSSPLDTKLQYPREPVIITAITAFILWSLLLTISLYLNLSNLRTQVSALATKEAKTNWDKDFAFRGWATRHGGVYIQPDERTPPNIYLAHVKNRDVVTRDGVSLTLMNPAYMMRQMTQEYEKTYGVKGNITGKILLNPINAPDQWEKIALDRFEQGTREVVEEATIDGSPYIRYMKPMVMEIGCLKCHGHLGFKVGDIRGGVSVSIPLTPYLDSASTTSNYMKFSHSAVWFLGVVGIIGFTMSARKRDKDRYRLQQEITLSNNMLEKRVKERTAELEGKKEELLQSQARAHYANKMASLGEMASGMAHEINSPLQAISLTAFRVKRKVDKMDNAEVSKSMAKVDDAVSKISTIIESLRNMSRESMDDQFENIAVMDIIADATGITNERYKTKGIEFNVRYHDGSEKSSLSCQRLQIAQILINLLNNGFDAALESKDKWIDLDVYDVGEAIEISVTDSGAGIPAEVRERIFEPLYTSKDIGRGTGLGLSISSEITMRHGGSLELDSNSANTRFVLCLPKSQAI